MQKQPIFIAYNRHVPSCGQPPRIDTQDGDYHSYFENEHGEQWLFVYDRKAGTATLRGGDIGWDDPKTMSKPDHLDDEDEDDFDLMLEIDVLLAPTEIAWLRACWAAALAFES